MFLNGHREDPQSIRAIRAEPHKNVKRRQRTNVEMRNEKIHSFDCTEYKLDKFTASRSLSTQSYMAKSKW